MERPKGIADNSHPQKGYFNLSAVSIFTILLFHLAGLIGLSLVTYRPLFLTVVPVHLVLMFFLVTLNHKYLNKGFFIFIFVIFLFGFVAEWIGVHTNVLFGEYRYGKTLGIKVAGIPLVMCVNWFLLIYITGVFTQKVRLKNNWVRIVTGAVILVMLDLLIEPIAMRFDYWHWQNNQVPVMNYVCWFLVSFSMLYLFERFEFAKQPWPAPVLLISQFIFFVALNLIYSR